MTDTPTVRPGQIWADNDKRSHGRKVRIIAIEPAQPAEPNGRAVPERALVEQVTGSHNTPGRRTRIRTDRFKPTATGYRLVTDA